MFSIILHPITAVKSVASAALTKVNATKTAVTELYEKMTELTHQYDWLNEEIEEDDSQESQINEHVTPYEEDEKLTTFEFQQVDIVEKADEGLVELAEENKEVLLKGVEGTLEKFRLWEEKQVIKEENQKQEAEMDALFADIEEACAPYEAENQLWDLYDRCYQQAEMEMLFEEVEEACAPYVAADFDEDLMERCKQEVALEMLYEEFEEADVLYEIGDELMERCKGEVALEMMNEQFEDARSLYAAEAESMVEYEEADASYVVY
ncbi:hypothetical protein SAICODRAFT_6660 [Saitoella complicata NRRL Y-17804]|uniref:Uncharacterized protein n=1 Tax=Saitoella complicata (strain BCRC 22490 / CBS 7301 / JCM 7358 / NBRC 10748 / NRRL Y-17804) TaxID=698492 RepID=A0A0E9NBZ7_SAICN|nr:uncharacterized protein SAICODRAFT_6660 [Saitoella complicata NRRL Y-17804]ODQ53877.1 hypothetical protein SAICODRAFT_6660 [Saitoella complicata NRRL Y-17804]GAO46915.1 hypothetical protein G7K_1133-t1 [Saitoella complicata NRRL Y-17804]